MTLYCETTLRKPSLYVYYRDKNERAMGATRNPLLTLQQRNDAAIFGEGLKSVFHPCRCRRDEELKFSRSALWRWDVVTVAPIVRSFSYNETPVFAHPEMTREVLISVDSAVNSQDMKDRFSNFFGVSLAVFTAV
jgi:hypothetical protein